jgi:hypothetical protein
VPGAPSRPSGPGVTWQYDATAVVPTSFTGTPAPVAGTGWSLSGVTSGPALPTLSGTRFGLKFVDGLKLWNGSDFVDPGTEQLQVFTGDATQPFNANTAQVVTTDTIVPGAEPTLTPVNPIGTTWSNSAHNSWSYRLLGDGTSPAAPSDDGIYLARFIVTSTALAPGTSTPIGASDPVYLIMAKNTPIDAAMGVAGTLGFAPSQVQLLVPEPAALVPALAGVSLLARRVRSSSNPKGTRR